MHMCANEHGPTNAYIQMIISKACGTFCHQCDSYCCPFLGTEAICSIMIEKNEDRNKY